MGSDPYGPGYHPDSQGNRPNLGDVGSGDQFGLDLYALYKAGRLKFPEQAARFSGLATDAQYAGSTITSVASAAGNPAALGTILDLRERLHSALYLMTTALREIGPVLVNIADDYAATDESARRNFTDMLNSLPEKGSYPSGPVHVPDPPRPDEPYRPTPEMIPKPGGIFIAR